MIRNIEIIVCALGLILGGFITGLFFGENKAFENIISEKCWLNKTSRDIECIYYIAK